MPKCRKVRLSCREPLNWLPKLSYFENDFFLEVIDLLILEKYFMGTLVSSCCLFTCSFDLTFFSFTLNRPARCFLILRVGMPRLKNSPHKLPRVGRKSCVIVSSLRPARLVMFSKFSECIVLIFKNLLACFGHCLKLCCSSGSLLLWQSVSLRLLCASIRVRSFGGPDYFSTYSPAKRRFLAGGSQALAQQVASYDNKRLSPRADSHGSRPSVP